MKLPAWFAGECIGTFLLVFFGCGAVASTVLHGALVGVVQVAIVWGLGIALAIFVTGGLSGAHLNPAVTCALAAAGRFPARRVAGYAAAQFLGALAAAAALHLLFADSLRTFEAAGGIVRGAPGSEASAMIFAEYFPNPAGKPLTVDARAGVTPLTAFLVELIGTAVLAFVILALTEERNVARPRELAPLAIGLTVTLLISLFAPLTQAGFNPARDLAPRVWSAIAGWGAVPFATNGWGWLTVYVMAPLMGGQAAAWLYRVAWRPMYMASARAG